MLIALAADVLGDDEYKLWVALDLSQRIFGRRIAAVAASAIDAEWERAA